MCQCTEAGRDVRYRRSAGVVMSSSIVHVPFVPAAAVRSTILVALRSIRVPLTLFRDQVVIY